VPDIFLAYIAGYAKFGKDNVNAVSASMRYFSLVILIIQTRQEILLGTGMPREYSFDLGIPVSFPNFYLPALASGIYTLLSLPC